MPLLLSINEATLALKNGFAELFFSSAESNSNNNNTDQCTLIFTIERWRYPRTPSQKAHYRVFEDLWSRRFFITGGAKFGGTFLAYPADPLRFHAHFIVSVIEENQNGRARLSPLELGVFGRIGTIVKKSCVLASLDTESDRVVYITIGWFNKFLQNRKKID